MKVFVSSKVWSFVLADYFSRSILHFSRFLFNDRAIDSKFNEHSITGKFHYVIYCEYIYIYIFTETE